MPNYLWLLAIPVGLFLAALAAWRPLRAWRREARFTQARHDFHRCREQVEAKFFEIAAASGKPRGLAWTNCDFENDVVYVRDRHNGELSAFVGVTIGFRAIAGGGMEEVEAVGDLRAATAVFRLRDVWSTDGRVIFNLNPTEAAERFLQDWELVEHETAHPARL